MEENFKSPYIDEKILYVSFNQDSSCFSIGTEKGFRIYSTFPYKNIIEVNNDIVQYRS